VGIGPIVPLEEEACRKRLTSYEAYSIRKALSLNKTQEKSTSPLKTQEQTTWAKSEHTRELWTQENIVTNIKELKDNRIVSEKIEMLRHWQKRQVNHAFEGVKRAESDPNFEWSIVQIDQKFRPVGKAKETTVITVYFKRTPRSDVNPVALYTAIEKVKAERIAQLGSPPPPPPPPNQEGGKLRQLSTMRDNKWRATNKDNTASSSSSQSSSPSSVTMSYLSSYATTVSSSTSMAYQPGVGDRLTVLLYEDEDLRRLYNEALDKTTLSHFEEDFKRCLLQLSAQLQAKASSPEERQVANAIRKFSPNAARIIRKRLQSHRDTRTIAIEPPDIFYSDETYDGSESDELDPIEDLDEQTNSPKDMEAFILHSKSFDVFKDSLRECLLMHSDPIRLALSKIWPVRCSQHEIPYEITWELPQFLALYLGSDQSIGDALALTGDSLNAQALSCRDYLKFAWPDIGSVILEGVEKSLSLGEDGENSFYLLFKEPN
jgi:hypothetical protein